MLHHRIALADIVAVSDRCLHDRSLRTGEVDESPIPPVRRGERDSRNRLEADQPGEANEFGLEPFWNPSRASVPNTDEQRR
jgi:hypothetical protein